MDSKQISAAVVVALAILSRPALAQRAPDFAILDRGDGISRLGLDLGLVLVDPPPSDAAMRLELFGQALWPVGLGVYGAFPVARSIGASDDETALGDLELGGLFVLHRPDISFVFRGGIALPTAGDEPLEVTINFLATQVRLTDIAMIHPDAFYARLAFSPLVHLSNLFLRADLGADLPIEDELQADTLLRLNLGAGVDLGLVALMAELANLATTEDFGDGEHFLHSFALTARFMGELLQPHISVGLPLDKTLRDQVDLFLAAGLQLIF